MLRRRTSLFNIIRADFYRIMHSKLFYLIQVVLFLLLLIAVLSHTTFLAGIQPERFMKLVHEVELGRWTGAKALVGASLMAASLIYFYLPILMLSIGHDLTHGTINNLITTGTSRKVFFLSKYLGFIFLSFIEYAIYYIFAFGIASFHSGVGHFEEGFIFFFVQSMIVQFLSLQAIFIITILVLYITRSNAIAALATVSFPVLLSTFSVLLFPKNKITQYLDFQGNINNTFIPMSNGYWINVSLISIAFIIIIGLITYTIFKRKELG